MKEAIVVENLSKEFVVREKMGFFSAHEQHIICPLNNISFSVKHGEVVGIIGPNGSGKSTLLKLLAGVYTPTRGSIYVEENLCLSLLRTGFSFDEELNGIDNVQLQASILGISRDGIRTKMNRIFSSADLKDYKDVQLKKYSDGMKMRLAFSIALAVEADIYLLDEIISVGDEDFQKRSFEMISRLKRTGKTCIIVSHEVMKLKNLCDRLLYIDKGQLIMSGNPERVIIRYMKDTSKIDEQMFLTILEDIQKRLKIQTSSSKSIWKTKINFKESIRQELFAYVQRLESILFLKQQEGKQYLDNNKQKEFDELRKTVLKVSHLFCRYYIEYLLLQDEIKSSHLIEMRNNVLNVLEISTLLKKPEYELYKKMLLDMQKRCSDYKYIKKELEQCYEALVMMEKVKKNPLVFNTALQKSNTKLISGGEQEQHGIQQHLLHEVNPLHALIDINYDSYLGASEPQLRMEEFEKLKGRFLDIYTCATSNLARIKSLFHMKLLFEHEITVNEVLERENKLKNDMNHYLAQELKRLESKFIRYNVRKKEVISQLAQKNIDAPTRYQLQAFLDSLERNLERIDKLIHMIVSEQINLYDKDAIIQNKGAGTQEVFVTKVKFLNKKKKMCTKFRTGDDVFLQIGLKAKTPIAYPHIGVAIYDDIGNLLIGPNNKSQTIKEICGECCVFLVLKNVPFASGRYYVTVGVFSTDVTEMYDMHYKKFSFDIINSSTIRGEMLHIPFEWRTKKSI